MQTWSSIITVVTFAACGPGGKTSLPASAAARDLSLLVLDPATGFHGEAQHVASDPVWWQFHRNDAELSASFTLAPWDAKWPADIEVFAAKLAEPSFIDDQFRYLIAKREQLPDGWLFTGSFVSSSGEQTPGFVLVRTVDGTRFYCENDPQNDAAGMAAAIAACRTAHF